MGASISPLPEPAPEHHLIYHVSHNTGFLLKLGFGPPLDTYSSKYLPTFSKLIITVNRIPSSALQAVMAVSIEAVFVLIWILSVVQIIAVSLRIWIVAGLQRNSLASSEYFLIIALVMSLVGVSGNTWLLEQTRIQATATGPPDLNAAILSLRTAFVIGQFYHLTMYGIKASLLALYFGVFRRLIGIRAIAIVLWSSVAFTMISFIVTMATSLFACMPVSRGWSLDNYCTAIYFMWVFGLHSGLSMSTDILVMIIPIALGMQMNLSRRLHFAIFFILAIGAVSIVANIVRFTGILPIAGPQLGIGGSVDAVRTVMFWSHIEFACAFVAACLPSYRALWLKKNEAKSTSGSRDYSNSKSTRSKASDEEDTIALAVRPSSSPLTPERSPTDGY